MTVAAKVCEKPGRIVSGLSSARLRKEARNRAP